MHDRLMIDGDVVAELLIRGPLGESYRAFDVQFEVETEEQLRQVVTAFGGIERFKVSDTGRMLTYQPPDGYFAKTRDHDRSVHVSVFLSDELAKPVERKPVEPAAVTRLREESYPVPARDAAEVLR